MTGVPSAWRRGTRTRSPSRSPPTSRWAAPPGCSRAAPSTCRSSSTSARCRWLMADALSGACSSMADRTPTGASASPPRSEEHTSELQSHHDLVCRLLLEKKKTQKKHTYYYQQLDPNTQSRQHLLTNIPT